MLAAVKKGKPVDETEIPPPVATGAPSAAPPPPVPARPAPPVPRRPEPTTSDQQVESEATTPPDAVLEMIAPTSEEEHSSSTTLPSLSSLPSPEEPTVEPAQPRQSSQTHGQFVLDYIKLQLLWKVFRPLHFLYCVVNVFFLLKKKKVC